jgi:hypothetical protein
LVHVFHLIFHLKLRVPLDWPRPRIRTATISRYQIDAIDALDTGARGGPDPDSITLEAYGKGDH